MTDMTLATKQRRVIFVGNINNLEENKIENLFIPFGPIQSIKKVDNHSFAFVQYEEANDEKVHERSQPRAARRKSAEYRDGQVGHGSHH